jgi:hypothetical protein
VSFVKLKSDDGGTLDGWEGSLGKAAAHPEALNSAHLSSTSGEPQGTAGSSCWARRHHGLSCESLRVNRGWAEHGIWAWSTPASALKRAERVTWFAFLGTGRAHLTWEERSHCLVLSSHSQSLTRSQMAALVDSIERTEPPQHHILDNTRGRLSAHLALAKAAAAFFTRAVRQT